jgi:PAS domain S-box-containing protein
MAHGSDDLDLAALRRRVAEQEHELRRLRAQLDAASRAAAPGASQEVGPAGDGGRSSAERDHDHRHLFHRMPMGVVFQAADGRIVDANAAASEILGLSLAQMQGRASVDPHWRAIREDGSPFPGEEHPAMVSLATGLPVRDVVMGIYHPAADRHRWLLVSSMPLFRDGDPAPHRVFTTFSDVTDRREAERALRKSEELLSLALAIGHIGVFEVDLDSGVGTWNPAVASLWGMEDGFVGSFVDLCWSRVHPDDLAKTSLAFDRMIETGEVGDMEFRVVRPDGDLRWINWLGQVVTDPRTHARRAVGVNVDVTERQRAAEALRRRAEEVEALMDLAPSAIFFSSDPACRQVTANRAAKRLFDDPMEAGRSTGDQRVDDVTPLRFYRDGREIGPDELPLRLAATKGVEVHDLEVEVETVSGRRVVVEGSAAPLRDAEHRVRGSVAVFANVTERKRAEEARRQLDERLQQAQRLESLGVLAGGIAHDFNNILMGIMGNAELCLATLPELSPPRDFLHELKASAMRAAELCKQMLAYSGKGRFEKRPLSINTLIEETLEMVKTSISKKCVLNLRLEKLLPKIQADPSQIRQVLMNLVINASEAIGDRSGVISITTGAMECSERYLLDGYLVDAPKPGFYAYLEVSDTGCGMDRSTVQRMFEPFFTTKFTGRGLGLAAVLGIVRGHGGALRVYSEPGKGTTLKVLIPAVTEAAPPELAAEPLREWKGAGTILLADDEETVRAVTARLLRLLGFEVLTAEDGRVAVELYRERRREIDVVILDLTMPHVGGEEATRQIRLLDPDAKIVLASGWDEHDFGPRFAGKRLSGFLQKPYTLVKLRALLAELVPGADASAPT